MPEAPHARVLALREQINRHNHLYYVEARTEISDAAFDALLDELTALEKQHPETVTPDSPTQRVGGAPIAGFKEVRHRLPMLSLDKATTSAELRDFDAKLRKAAGGPVRYTVEPKIDGIAISVVYRDGLLEVGATRGDGDKGDDVTHNLRAMSSVPLRLKGDPPPLLEVRGEVYMTKGDFAKLNATLDVKDRYANPRNLTAGSMKLLDPRESGRRKLRMLAYAVGAVEGREFAKQTEVLEALKGYGFVVSPEIKAYDDIEGVLGHVEAYAARRNDLEYEIDGLVLKLDDMKLRAKLGATSKHVRWAIAFKFPPQEGVTRVLGIDIHVGKYGEQTPVAVLAPVQLEGTTVESATLHNASMLKQKDVRVGDTVLVVKRGGIIPHVEKVMTELRPPEAVPFVFPSRCPECGAATKLNAKEGGYLCTAVKTCPKQIQGRIESFAKRERMDITGLGEEMSMALVKSGLVKIVSDLYKLTEEKLLSLERVGKKSAQNLLAGIEASKGRGLGLLLSALSIPNVGETFGPVLGKAIGSMEKLLSSSKEELARLEGFGPTRAESVYNYFHSPEGEQLVNDLQAAGVKLTEDVVASTLPQVFAGKSIVVTGTLKNYDRRGIEKRIEELGGKAGSSVSKNTDYLLVGADAGSKLAKARSLGITIIDEEEFEEMAKKASAKAPEAALAVPAPAPPPAPSGGLLAGKTVVVTGTLTKYDRKGINALIERHGGKSGSGVSKNTSLLVAGEDAGSKLASAKALGVQVVSEEEFEKMLAAPAPKTAAAPAPKEEAKPAKAPKSAPKAEAPKAAALAPAPSGGAALAGQIVVVTGTLTKYDRKGINALIEQHGGKAGGDVSRNTNLLVCGEDAGSKLAKAKTLGVKVVSEAEFEKLLG